MKDIFDIFNSTNNQNPSPSNDDQNNDRSLDQHSVHPHIVHGYDRADGTHVAGYWRDGDGDTTVDHTVDDGGGYWQSNPHVHHLGDS